MDDNRLMDTRIDKLLTVQEQLLALRQQDREEIRRIRSRVAKVEEIQDKLWKVDTYQQHDLKKAAKTRVADIIKQQHGQVEKLKFNELFRLHITRLWRDYQNAFNVPRYGETRAKQFEAAIDWIVHWVPSVFNDLSEQHQAVESISAPVIAQEGA